MNQLARFLLLGAVACLGACTFNVTEGNFVRPTPDPPDAPSPAQAFAELGAAIEVLQIPAAEGAQLHAVVLTQSGARLTVLHFGGNLSRVSASRDVAQRLLPLGVNLVLVDHRGSGQSSGEPNVDRLLADALTAFDFLVSERKLAPRQVIVHGHSLGSFMAGHVARHRQVGGLVLSGSATSTEDWVAASVPWYAKPVVRTEIAPGLRGRGNRDVVLAQSSPLLVIGGGKDEQAPPKLSKKLAAAAAAAQKPVTLVIAKRANHNNLLEQEEVIAAYAAFLRQLAERVD